MTWLLYVIWALTVAVAFLLGNELGATRTPLWPKAEKKPDDWPWQVAPPISHVRVLTDEDDVS